MGGGGGPSTLPLECQWAILPLLSTIPPSPVAPVGRPTAAVHPSSLLKQRLWAAPRLHSLPISARAAPVGVTTATLLPSPPTTQ